ncbi:prenyltransferase/squalene oxidase repeat-containing protein [Streptomyces sp. NPDC006649]|uniref:terpene synthase family protein n=1 Tax=Streptomyces sp. NPDC006649 TaxID=3156896 RepID=UPI0033B74D43
MDLEQTCQPERRPGPRLAAGRDASVTVVEATARLRSRVEERVEADGALREPCRSRVLESALVLALMRRLMDFSGSRERVTRYLWLRCKSPDPLERSLALVGSGAGPAPEGEDFRTLILEQVPSYVAPRRRLVLDAVAVILGGHTGRSPETAAATAAATASATVPSSAADPAGSAPSGVLHPWARVQSVASAVIVRSTQDGPVEISADDLVVLRATQDGSGRVWEGHLLAHVLALHALARLPGNDHLVRRGLTAMLPLQRADGGFPFVSDIDTWCTAIGGLALAVAGASTSLLHQVAGHLVSEQKQCGGWSITNGTRLTDTDDTSVALEFLQALDPGRYKHEIDAGLGRLRALRGPDGGFPTYVAGGPSEACMTAAAVNAFAPAGRGDARLLEEARRFLAASQHRDGYFEPGWSNSRLHVLYRARMAAGPGASGLAMAARIRQLVADTQNPDGGWSREPGHTSDAISTSYALLALGRQATGSPPQRAGARWLCERQDADGGFDSPPDMVGPRPFTYHVPLLTDICVLRALGHLTRSPARNLADPPAQDLADRHAGRRRSVPAQHRNDRAPGEGQPGSPELCLVDRPRGHVRGPRGLRPAVDLSVRPPVRSAAALPGQSFRMPVLAHQLPRALHADSERLMAETGAWAHEHLGFAYDGDHDRVEHNVDGTLLVALSIPHAGYDLALVCSKLMNHLIGIENSLVDRGALGGSSFATRGVFSRLMSDLVGWQDGATPLTAEFRWLRRRMPRPAWERFVACMEDFAYGFTTELEQWREEEYTGYEDYLHQRRSSLGVRWLFGFAEAQNPALPLAEETFRRPEMKALHDTAVDGYTLINDLVSYRREAAMGDTMNLVHHLRESEGLTTGGAMNRLCTLIDATEAHFLYLREQIMDHDARRPSPVPAPDPEPRGDPYKEKAVENPEGLRGYLDTVGHIMTSNLWWATLSNRYEHGGLQWDGTCPGTMTLHTDRTEFVPDPS